MAFIRIISAITEALYAERKMNVDRFSVMFSAFNFKFDEWDIRITNKNFYILGDCNPSVLWHSKETLVNFTRHLTIINILYLAYLKHEQCSQQYSVKHVLFPMNWYRQQTVF
jgi:hypothetical protein